MLISNSREFANKRQGRHFSATEKILPSAKIVGYDVANLSVKHIQKRSSGEKVATETFMIREKEALLKQHCQLGKQMQELKAKFAVCEYEYNAIENCLCELERDKDSKTDFESTRRSENKEVYQRMYNQPGGQIVINSGIFKFYI